MRAPRGLAALLLGASAAMSEGGAARAQDDCGDGCGEPPADSYVYDDFAPEDQAAIDAFVINNTISTLYHELGHAFVDLFHLPVLGREEDAVDNLSTLLMLDFQPDEQLDQMMVDAADVYYLSDLELQAEGYEPDYADVHGLDLQRYYAVVCIVYGSDPERFQDLADEAELDADRQESCGFDYDQARTAWDTVLEPHRGDSGAEAPRLVLSYDEPAPESARVADLAANSPELAGAADAVSATYMLPQQLDVVFSDCDEENAWYDPETQSITMCYQLLTSFERLAISAYVE